MCSGGCTMGLVQSQTPQFQTQLVMWWTDDKIY